MDASFWLERWAQGRIGFHLPQTHPRLVRCWPRMKVAPGGRVLVPLCGKTHDLQWLASQGCQVLGVELSETAARAFFAEHGRVPQRKASGAFIRYAEGGVEILVGDFFDLTAAEMAGVAAVYDRAALVALPPEMRQRYAAHLLELLPQAPPMLVIGLEYDQAQMAGPPFSVSPEALRALYGLRYRVAVVERNDIIAHETRFREQGLTSFIEYVAVCRPA